VNHSVADVPMLQGRSLVARNSLVKGKVRSQPVAVIGQKAAAPNL
jgi:hypothetical protein